MIKKYIPIRNSIVDMSRFIACSLIIFYHSFHLGLKEYHFREGWIFIGLFFILSGYYTVKHFMVRESAKTLDEASKKAIYYTISKFMQFLPYTTVAILLQYLCVNIDKIDNGIKPFLSGFTRMPFEMMLLSSIAPSPYTTTQLAPIWSISAMFLVFPLFCCLVQIKSKYFLLIISFITPLVYYGFIDGAVKRVWPNDYLRIICGMLLGVSIYLLIWMFDSKITMLCKIPAVKFFLTFIEAICLIFPIYASYNNWESLRLFNFFCIAVSVGIMCSEYSYSSHIKSRLLSFLGKLSMPMYIFHWIIGTVIVKFFNVPLEKRVIYCYISSIVISGIAYFIIEFCRSWINKKIYNIIVKYEFAGE